MNSRGIKVYFSLLGGLALVFSVYLTASLWPDMPLWMAVGFGVILIAFLILLGFLIVRKVRPSPYSMWIGGGLCVLGILVALFNQTTILWLGALALWGFASVVDLLFLLLGVRFSVERTLPGRFAQGIDDTVKLKIKNEGKTGYHVMAFDGVPQHGQCKQMPWQGVVPGERFIELEYIVQISQRGWAEFKQTFLQVMGPLRLWNRVIAVPCEQEARVYPNYEPVLQLALMSMESNPEQMGIVKKNRAGLSKEFHQLRDYHEGDMLSQIDWKASSKRQSLISRSYHEQRDQNVVLAIDCGRRMRAHDGDISQFDHCLNAMLLLAYVALKQGDNVGVMAYGGREHWLPPVKGVESMTTILNHLFNYQTSSSPSDYGEAVERVLLRQKRRAMVVFISNFRGEDAAELVEPLRKLRQRHIVTLGNIREKEVDEAILEEVSNFDEAIRLASIEKYLASRKTVMNQLKSINIPSVDVTADELPIALANQYLAMREMV